MTTFGFIGTGHLGSMLVDSFVRGGAIKGGEIWVSNRSQDKAQKLADELGVRAADNLEIAERSDVIFLCVRPMDLEGVISEIHELLTPDKLIVSVAVDFTLSRMQKLCSARTARAIPSVTSIKGLGVTLLVLGDAASEDDRSLLLDLFRSIGWPVEVAEEQLEVISDLTSCAPAYIAAILSEFALEASRRGAGVERDLAEDLIKKTLIGTAALLEDMSLDDLISIVATPGGITEEGVRAIRACSPEMFRQLFLATSSRHRLVRERTDDIDIIDEVSNRSPFASPGRG